MIHVSHHQHSHGREGTVEGPAATIIIDLPQPYQFQNSTPHIQGLKWQGSRLYIRYRPKWYLVLDTGNRYSPSMTLSFTKTSPFKDLKDMHKKTKAGATNDA